MNLGVNKKFKIRNKSFQKSVNVLVQK